MGVNTITDPSNKTNTYEYDAFSRLMIIKDQDGNVVKKNEYVYVNPDPNTGLTIFYNAARTDYPVCTSCLPGYTASVTNPVGYFIPYGKHYSLINQDDAEAKATADLATNGQEYVNKNSVCSNSATCTGAGYKFVSCACELGVRVCESSTQDQNGGWLSNWHLRWSDGSVSPTFSEYIASCTGVDKKFLNCICEPGTKVCDAPTVNNGGGSYTVYYHYHFSDNTNSAPITETITCSGIDKKMIGCICETAIKVCVSSVYCSGQNPPAGCCQGMWWSGFYYKWSDGSTLYNTGNTLFYECRATASGCSVEFGGGDDDL